MSNGPDAAYTPSAPTPVVDPYAGSAYFSSRGNNTMGGGARIVHNDIGGNEGVNKVSKKVMNSDEQLQRDEEEAIDKRNILGRAESGIHTRHAKPRGTYKEPGDEEGLPGPDDGTSRVRTERLDTEGTLRAPGGTSGAESGM